MPKIHSFTVVASLPECLQPLRDLSSNLWWTWNHSAKELFYRIAKERTTKERLNPIKLINSLSSEEIENLQQDKGFLSQLQEVVKEYEKYREASAWWNSCAEDARNMSIAYFSAEFGLHETVRLYSGGLGVLAGDHLKAASDLGIPLVGIGLLYYEGYFSQYLNADGWQQESYPQINLNSLPIAPALDSKGKQVSVAVDINGIKVMIRTWKAQIGLTTLYLLDTNNDDNPPAYRGITSRLYGGDLHTRIRQEIVLGIGGCRVLKALGIYPDVHHMNEGHSGFLALERVKDLMTENCLSFEAALVGVREGNLFTTHTPVPAGNDVFSKELIAQYFSSFVKDLDIELDQVLRLGRLNPENKNEPFSMAVFALNTSGAVNAVSKLHKDVSRKLWQANWPELPLDESPIDSITNGIHTTTWTSRDMAELYDRYLGPNWRSLTANPDTWTGVTQIPEEELWRIICRSRTSLVTYCRERMQGQLLRRGAGRAEVEAAGQALDPDALTIGFARRFATYKRATLILHDIDRLARLVSDMKQPVQFIFAGKSHPADNTGKELIAALVHAERRPELRGRFVFIEDYDMNVGRHLVQGVDVWMNNPRRPLEASGTSGMKVSVNGGLNFSVLDGWWCEAFDGANGWCIGQGEEYEDQNYHDQVESRSMYDLLEREIIPTFYNRTNAGIPKAWLQLVTHSIRSVAPQFSANRMVADYARKFYLPLGKRHKQLEAGSYSNAVQIASSEDKFSKHWSEVEIIDVQAESPNELAIGKPLSVKVKANLGPFTPDDIAVQVRYGSLDVTNTLRDSTVERLNSSNSSEKKGVYEFSGSLQTSRAGNFGFAVRLVPVIAGQAVVSIPKLITWWQ